MGFKISWLAVEGLPKDELLDALGFIDLNEDDEVNEAPFSAADLRNGWSVIWSNDCGWAEVQSPSALSSDRYVVSVQVHEGLMYARSQGRRGPRQIWEVVHDAQRGPNDLRIEGTPPDLEDVRSGILAQQELDGSGEIDYIFEIPVEIAARATGLKHDEWDLRTGPRPHFTVVTPAKSTG